MTQDEQAIHHLVERFIEGWNRGDGQICASAFAEDADFIAVTGLRAKGREVIGRGQSEILAAIYRGTQLTGTVNSIRFVRPDVAVADVTLRIIAEPGRAWVPKCSSLGFVATRDDGRWSIAVFRNMVPYERPMDGPLERSMMAKQREQESATIAR